MELKAQLQQLYEQYESDLATYALNSTLSNHAA
jgi:hypothetical protein